MYRVDRRLHRHKRARRNFIIIGSVVVTGALIYGLFHIRIAPKQDLHNAPSVSKAYNPNSAKYITVSKPFFTMQLPYGWTEVAHGSNPDDPKYSFHSAAGQAQLMDMYIDSIPTPFGINRAVVVSGSGNGVAHDTVSDNCSTFTDGGKKNPQTGLAPAKWQGTDFQCDMANFARAVVGTISKEGQNFFLATGASGTHRVFITYTDNNINPDYSVLYGILESLHFN